MYLSSGDLEVRNGELKSSGGISKYGTGSLPINTDAKMASGKVMYFENSGGTETGSISRDDDNLNVDSGSGGNVNLQHAGTDTVQVTSDGLEVVSGKKIIVKNSGNTEQSEIYRDDDDFSIDSASGADLQLKHATIPRVSIESDGTYVRDSESCPLLIETDDGSKRSAISRDATSLNIDSGTDGITKLKVEGVTKVNIDGSDIYPETTDSMKNGKSGSIWSETHQDDIYQYDTHYMTGTETVQTSSELSWVTAHTYSVSTGHAVQVEAWATGLDNAGNAAAYHIKGLFKNIGGLLTQVGSTTTLSSNEDVANCDVRFSISGTDVLTQVSGTINTMNWYVNLRVQDVAMPT